MKHALLITSSLLALMIAMPGAGDAAQPSTTTNSKQITDQRQDVSQQDRDFVGTAAMSGLAEVQMGKVAQEKTKMEQVRDFAERMVKDHSKTNDELQKLASKLSITTPAVLDSAHKNAMDELQKLSGGRFDLAYIEDQVDAHQKAIDAFQKEADAGQQPELKDFARGTIPTLKDHLQQAQTVRTEVGRANQKTSQNEVFPMGTDIQGVIGKDVYGENGHEVGEVENLLIGKDGRVQAAIVEFGGFLGVGENQVAVPWDRLHVAGDRVNVRMTQAEIKSAPVWHEDDRTGVYSDARPFK